MEGIQDMQASTAENSPGASKTVSMEVMEAFAEVLEASMEVTFVGKCWGKGWG